MEQKASEISAIIQNYRNGDVGKLDTEHVLRWVNQFEAQDQLLVLSETKNILDRNYLSEKKVNESIDIILSPNNTNNNDPVGFWSNCSLLEIQINGKSQSALIEKFTQRLQKKYGITPKINQKSNTYVYLDDFLFSGNRIQNDVTKLLQTSDIDNCNIIFMTFGYFQSGQFSTSNNLKKLFDSLKRNIRISYTNFEGYDLENRLTYKNSSEVFWPTQNVLHIPEVNHYLSKFNKMPTFRDNLLLNNRVFNPVVREQFELAMLKAGVKILSFCKDPSRVVKPLGYSSFDGFGFGSTVFTYRNCPNNNPLAFWWGDKTKPSTHPFSKWYPLLERKTYD